MFDYDPNADDLSDLDREYGGEYRPESGGFLPGLEALPDGAYEFEVLREAGGKKSGLDKAANGDRIVNLLLHVLPDGASVQHTYWLNRQESVNQFGADMRVLGFDSDQWGSQARPLSREIPRCAGQLAGIRFAASKTSRRGKEGTANAGKVYHNLQIIRRLGGQAAPQQPAPANGPMMPAAVGGDSSKCPF